MWTSSREEQVFQGRAGQMQAKAFIVKWDRPKDTEVMTEDSGLRRKYYTFRIEFTVGSYVFHNYGVTEPNMPMYFAHKGNVIAEIKSIMDEMRVREEV